MYPLLSLNVTFFIFSIIISFTGSLLLLFSFPQLALGQEDTHSSSSSFPSSASKSSSSADSSKTLGVLGSQGSISPLSRWVMHSRGRAANTSTMELPYRSPVPFSKQEFWEMLGSDLFKSDTDPIGELACQAPPTNRQNW